MHEKSQDTQTFRLDRYYHAIVGTSLLALLLIAFVTRGFPEFFPWIRYPVLHFWVFIGVAAGQAILLLLYLQFRKKSFFVIDRYNFVVFFFLLFYAQGGVKSPFLWTILFPLLVSIVDLDARETRRMGTIVTVLLGLFIFADPPYLSEPDTVVRHVIQTLLYGLAAFYTYKVVKETLRQKYEKEELERQLAETVEVTRLKSDFLTVAEHQLRTPLSGARWSLYELLPSPALSEEVRAVVRRSYEHVDRAMEIVNEMLKTAEFEAGPTALSRVPVDLGVVVQSLLRDLSYLLRAKKVEISVRELSRPTVVGDPKFLHAALSNIVDNAIRYAPSGSVTVELSTVGGGLRRDGEAVVRVIDSGIGIHADDLPFVATRFFRAKNAISLEPNESGVGLFITKRITELHGGTISFESSLGKGTTVTVRLPLAQS